MPVSDQNAAQAAELDREIYLVQQKLNALRQAQQEKPAGTFQDRGSQSEVNQRPIPYGMGNARLAGYPKVPTLSRTKRGTGLEITQLDEFLEHICGEKSYIRRAIANAKLWASKVGQAIRAGIEAILSAISSSPAVKWFVDKVKTVIKWIKWATKELQDLNEGILAFIRYVKIIMGVIQWILSLPEKLLKLFRDCLAKAYAELARAAMDIIKQIAAGASNAAAGAAAILEVQNLQKSLKDFQKEANKTVSLTNQAVSALTSPSSMSDADAAKYASMLADPQQREDLLKQVYSGDIKLDKTKYKPAM